MKERSVVVKDYSPLTKCVHSGNYMDETSRGVITPIYISSSYRMQRGEGDICYPRYYNIPTQKAAAAKIAALENAESALVLASGMAAVTSTLLSLMESGDHAVVQAGVYGGTHHFVASEMSRFNLEFTLVSSNDPADFEAAVKSNTKVVYFETPTNPLLHIVELDALADLARRRNLTTIIDNTFATPINQNPLEHGIDVVVHSGTKYLGGHSDLCCGVAASRQELMTRIHETAVNLGCVLGAPECYRLERSVKTLGLRMKQHNRNGLALAEFLSDHPRVRKVFYPGLPDHPGHEIAARQMRGFGGMMSVEPDGDQDAAFGIVERLELFTHAVSLGGVESLVCFPCLTSHEKVSAEERAALGISDSLVRVSVGIEETDDLIDDWKQALAG
jgi:cystathionine beta-lyase/cystathionine gamma-synthase